MTPAPSTEGKPRVLLVDDDVELCDLMVEFLRDHDFAIDAVHDGAAGLAAALRGAHDILVLDMMLPRRSGFLVLEQIQDIPEPPPVLMVTANEGRRHKAYAQSLGVGAYLNKPVAMERLLETVETLL